MYIKVKDGKIEKYPYSVNELKKDNPNVSFPSNTTDALLETFNVFRVKQIAQPSYDVANKNIKEGTPIKENSEWIQTWVIYDATSDEIAERTKLEASRVRGLRNNNISTCDWTQLPDSPLTESKKQEWSDYRQALRDITNQSGFPWNINWPVKP